MMTNPGTADMVYQPGPRVQPPVELSETQRQEWAALTARERQLISSPAVLARWTADLTPDDWTLADIVRLEKRRQQALQTLRSSAELTENEWKLLRYLQRNEGKTCTYLDIARFLWQTPSHRITATSLLSMDEGRRGLGGIVTTIHGIVHQIRYKLEIDPLRPQHLCNIRGVGYRWYAMPPSLDDGENYERRATESAMQREHLYRQLGLIEGEFTAVESQDREGTFFATRFVPGPEHPDYRALASGDEPE